jgi:hypothetical protein
MLDEEWVFFFGQASEGAQNIGERNRMITVMMLVKERSVQSNQGLPLFVVQLRLRSRVGLRKCCLFIVDFNTFRFNHHKARLHENDISIAREEHDGQLTQAVKASM